ncbi:MAG: hypothetical protein ACO1OX_05300 [Novosphingobium sp.]
MSVMLGVLSTSDFESSLARFEKSVAAYSRCQINHTAWLIDTNLSFDIVLKELSYGLDAKDQVFLTEVSSNWGFYNGGRPEQWLSAESRKPAQTRLNGLLNFLTC